MTHVYQDGTFIVLVGDKKDTNSDPFYQPVDPNRKSRLWTNL